ncbi:MAG: hypothetical protein ACMVY4_11915 [Minwuia sp.]|uniref:hypothetical protein n=1 Tax=Minwuia sp. TaxID=2493630 RepID=UPI003A844CFC
MGAREYRYPKSASLRDIGAAVIGLTFFGAPALFVPLSSVMVAVFGGLGALFAAFGVRTVLRHLSRYETDGNGLRVAGPVNRSIAWDGLSEVRLRYFSTWRDRKSGWLQLSLKGNGTVVRIDQALDGFEELVRTAIVEARSRGIGFDATTRQNAGALGLDLSDDAGSWAE